ncbi:MAG TPA: hypothetical protein VMI32_11575 [Candidatus Solibacter sp.]|nr:hypothetical protein [Candidatus Solibacter sp.]
MSSAPAAAVPHDEGIVARLRSLLLGALFALVLLIPRLLHIRRNPQSWMAFRIFLGFGGAAFVVLPLSLWKSWLAAPAGLAMFLAAILLPPAKPHLIPDDKARELGALVVLNGGTFQPRNAALTPVQFFVGPEEIWALDSRFHLLLVIPASEIASATALQKKDRWILRVRWLDNSAEFSYTGIFAEHLVRIAESTIAGVMHSPLPVLPRSRAASA